MYRITTNAYFIRGYIIMSDNLIEGHVRAVATKKLNKEISKELEVEDPENLEEVIAKNEIEDENEE